MDAVNGRPDFLLLNAVELRTRPGMHPHKMRTFEYAGALVPTEGIDLRYLRSSLEKELADTGMIHHYLEMTVHGGFEAGTSLPRERMVFNEYDEKKLRSFVSLEQERYLKEHNEKEFNKVLTYRQDLLNRKKEAIDVEYELRMANKWINAFLQWFRANDIAVSYPSQSAVSRKDVARAFSFEELADAYVNRLISGSGEEPSQSELERVTGISQSTWSKKLKKPELLELIKKKIDQILDNQGKLVHTRTLIENGIMKARSDFQASREKSIGAASELASEDSYVEEDSILERIDNEATSTLSENELIQRILKMDPEYKLDHLQGLSKENLAILYRNSG